MISLVIGIMMIVAQFIATIGAINMGNWSYFTNVSDFGVFLGDLIGFLAFCWMGIIGLILVILGVRLIRLEKATSKNDNEKTNTEDSKVHTRKLTLAAVITAMIILMSTTPLGYFKIGMTEITLLPIPVAIGAILLGPTYGAFFGFLFGATSFMQCFTTSLLGMLCLEINPIYTIVLCFVPRILAGYLTGLVFKLLRKKVNISAYIVSSAMSALLNTLFFVSTLVLLFGNSERMLALFGANSIFQIVTALVTLNALVEIAVCLIVGAAVSKALSKIGEKYIK